jgi:Immunoglobulin-like domain of bacterial spore germination
MTVRLVVLSLLCSCVAAATAAARPSSVSLQVTPATVHRGGTVTVHGNAAPCPAGDQVTIISHAFPVTHLFAGVPAVFATVRSGGAFSTRTTIPRHRKVKRYTVTARCGGGNLGIVRHLRVTRPPVTARSIRIAGHPAFVRATVRFAGGRLGSTDAEATDPSPFDGTARMRVDHARIRTTAPAAHRLGVRVRITGGTNRLRIRLTGAHRRFKYLAYRQLRSPERLVVDLYRAAPPTARAERPGNAASCLSIAQHADTGGTITASGRAHGIFENQFTLAVRATDGGVVGHRSVAFGGTAPQWSSTVSYAVTTNQPGTLEAVELSARDGALACLAQIRVPLAAPLTAPR